MSGLLRRLADGLLKPARGGVHPLARLRWLAPPALMPAEATRRSEVLPVHEAERPGPSQPSSAQAGAARSSAAAPPLSPEPQSPEPQEQSAHEGKAPSPLVRVEAAAAPAKTDLPAGPEKTVRVTASSVARAPAPRSEPDSVRTAAQRETGERVMRTALAADSPCAASAGEPEPLRASPPDEPAEAGECDAFESRRAPEGETPPTPSSRLAASAPADRPKAARAERDEREIHIHIGRIEVSALPSPPARKSSRPAAMSLDEYLSRRSGEKR